MGEYAGVENDDKSQIFLLINVFNQYNNRITEEYFIMAWLCFMSIWNIKFYINNNIVALLHYFIYTLPTGTSTHVTSLLPMPPAKRWGIGMPLFCIRLRLFGSKSPCSWLNPTVRPAITDNALYDLVTHAAPVGLLNNPLEKRLKVGRKYLRVNLLKLHGPMISTYFKTKAIT